MGVLLARTGLLADANLLHYVVYTKARSVHRVMWVWSVCSYDIDVSRQSV